MTIRLWMDEIGLEFLVLLQQNQSTFIDFFKTQKFIVKCLSQKIGDVTIAPDNAQIRLAWKSQRLIHMLGLRLCDCHSILLLWTCGVDFQYAEKVYIPKRSCINQFFQ